MGLIQTFCFRDKQLKNAEAEWFSKGQKEMDYFIFLHALAFIFQSFHSNNHVLGRVCAIHFTN